MWPGGLLGTISFAIWLVPEPCRAVSIGKCKSTDALFVSNTEHISASNGGWLADTWSRWRYMLFKHNKFVANNLEESWRSDRGDFLYLYLGFNDGMRTRTGNPSYVGIQSRSPSGGWESRFIIRHICSNIPVNYIETNIKPLYHSMHNLKYAKNCVPWVYFTKNSIRDTTV